jgi:uncharacterized protein DUF5615
VSIRFQADNDLNGLIVRATVRHEPAIAQAASLDRLGDKVVLQRASADGRILVTHDKRSMPRHFAEFLAQGHESPGVLVVIPQDAPLTQVPGQRTG